MHGDHLLLADTDGCAVSLLYAVATDRVGASIHRVDSNAYGAGAPTAFCGFTPKTDWLIATIDPTFLHVRAQHTFCPRCVRKSATHTPAPATQYVA
jgi:hypothetical protein